MEKRSISSYSLVPAIHTCMTVFPRDSDLRNYEIKAAPGHCGHPASPLKNTNWRLSASKINKKWADRMWSVPRQFPLLPVCIVHPVDWPAHLWPHPFMCLCTSRAHTLLNSHIPPTLRCCNPCAWAAKYMSDLELMIPLYFLRGKNRLLRATRGKLFLLQSRP